MVDTAFWKRRTKIYKREPDRRGKPKERFLIVCEGKCTEPKYFEGFRLSSVNVVIKGMGANTDSLVQMAIDERGVAASYGEYFDQVWCVFDRDSFTAQTFNRAFALAESNDIKIAHSNESFELWYVLHYEMVTTSTTRVELNRKLCALLGRKYVKNDRGIYLDLLDKQQAAIRRAKRLIRQYPSH